MLTNKSPNTHKGKYKRQVKTFGEYNEKDEHAYNGNKEKKQYLIDNGESSKISKIHKSSDSGHI